MTQHKPDTMDGNHEGGLSNEMFRSQFEVLSKEERDALSQALAREFRTKTNPMHSGNPDGSTYPQRLEAEERKFEGIRLAKELLTKISPESQLATLLRNIDDLLEARKQAENDWVAAGQPVTRYSKPDEVPPTWGNYRELDHQLHQAVDKIRVLVADYDLDNIFLRESGQTEGQYLADENAFLNLT